MVKGALSSGKRPEKVEVSPIGEVNLGAVVEEMTEKLDRFDAWKKQIVIDDRILGGEPVFPKSRLSVRHVGAMVLRGAKVEEIRENYSYLKEEDIEFAKLYTQARRRPVAARPFQFPTHSRTRASRRSLSWLSLARRAAMRARSVRSELMTSRNCWRSLW
jgi:uncharacterized protein (DUF433 family)